MIHMKKPLKINTQNSLAFLYTNNERSENRNQGTNPISSKRRTKVDNKKISAQH